MCTGKVSLENSLTQSVGGLTGRRGGAGTVAVGRRAGPITETGRGVPKLMWCVYIPLKHMAGVEWYPDVGFWKYNKV